MTLDKLLSDTLEANLELPKQNLVRLTWGNVSAVDRELGLMAIKPSGVPYSELTKDKLVVLEIESGKKVHGALKPSSDTATHLEIYRQWDSVAGVCHTHSVYATMFCQAGKEIPCFGTTHADNFYGPVPLCRMLNQEEVQGDYELETAYAIIRHFDENGLNPESTSAVLQHGHAPFTWGKSAMAAVHRSVALELVAELAYGTLILNSGTKELPNHIRDTHYFRQHGPNASYGQN